MKKCPDCDRDVDKATFACEYCGKLVRDHSPDKTADKTKLKDLEQHFRKEKNKTKAP